MTTSTITKDWGKDYQTVSNSKAGMTGMDTIIESNDSNLTITVVPEDEKEYYITSNGTTTLHQGTEENPYLTGGLQTSGNIEFTGSSDSYLSIEKLINNSGASGALVIGDSTQDHGSSSLTINGINLSVENGISGKPLTIQNGATVSASSVSSAITFGAAGDGTTTNSHNLLNITGTGKSAVIGSISNFTPSDVLEFSGNTTGTKLSWTPNKDGTYALYATDAKGKNKTELVKSLTFGTKSDGTLYSPSDFIASQNTVTGLEVITCFLSGSMIRMSEGDVAVEDIQIGDEVVAFDWKNNKEVTRPVVWMGKAHAVVRPGLPDDEAGYPVRVLKDAIADGVPYKDMLITAEHCLFFKDRFVPVRMLVNGVSIFYDKSITSYDYYHVETEQHSVITADGMLTESYLDTGNRSSFRQEGKVATLRGAVKSWADDAGAPLSVERSFVEPLFRALELRENSVTGAQIPSETKNLTDDPDLHLVTDAGSIVHPMRKTAHQYSFMLPPDTQSVRIVSRASRPSDVIGPFVDDRRYMGVAVADVRLQCAKQHFDITSHLQAEKPEGWYDTDWTDCAWTNGDAELLLGDYLLHGKMGILSMTVRAAGPYVVDNQTMTKTAKSA
ncbi:MULTISPECIES: Hint domain-containing protein [Acetobacter]|uniref:Hedgehog/Intein (Hint) domain-containing protein n=1 Tax=Acetobacter pomorum DM001 TaxID=945681 RepID=F1YWJ8_9PROT|nr:MULTISPECIES: Hint domain-containing protein [Acetobacter]ATI12890.1 hypothetical protein CPF11_10835 [Acetobacter pomorum]AXC26981.1 hypothetical protein DS739_09555 [Acetobacter sp. JWB]EGE46704.1 Hypothetical protein APO_2611 [Acetobacter pomorum DM001]KAA8425195.1 hypothetical protein FKW54_09605 [Acetobacter pomorum]KAA8432185.1 hypothetical protein FKW50_11670 [Acetobacter pomorum]